MKSLIAPLLMSLALGLAPALAAPLKPELKPEASLAFFGISFIDTSAEGAYFAARPDEAARLTMVRDYVIDQFEERGFRFLDLAPVRTEIDRTTNPGNCNDCEVRMAKQLGADYSVVGQVQKVSNLILSMNLVVRDAQTGTMARGMSVDIRGNTDESWQRGMRYILRNNVFKE
jgi:hypothetical protein